MSNRLIFIILGLVCTALVIGVSVFWLMKVGKTKDNANQSLAKMNDARYAAGVSVTYDAMKAGGYPFNPSARLLKPALRWKTGNTSPVMEIGEHILWQSSRTARWVAYAANGGSMHYVGADMAQKKAVFQHFPLSSSGWQIVVDGTLAGTNRLTGQLRLRCTQCAYALRDLAILSRLIQSGLRARGMSNATTPWLSDAAYVQTQRSLAQDNGQDTRSMTLTIGEQDVTLE